MPSIAANFDWFDTPNQTERGFIITAKEGATDEIPDFLGSTVTWSDCPAWVKKAEAVPTALQVYVLTHAAKAGYQKRSFYFTKPKTAEEAAVAFKSSYDVEPSLYWPPVMTELRYYRQDDGNYTFKPLYKEAYDGPTRVLIEEFFSPVPHSIAVPTTMQPQGVDDVVRVVGSSTDFTIGRLVLKSCLHPAIDLVLLLSPSVSEGAFTYTQGSLNVPATNLTDWPATQIIDDRQREVLGGWLRRKVTALKPS